MRRNLLETYSAQLNVADKYLSRNFDGKRLSNQTALTTAWRLAEILLKPY